MSKNTKDLFLKTDIEFVFKSSEFFKFFKYKRHNHFVRALDNPKFYKYLQFYEYEIINSRSASCIFFDRTMFLILCKKRNIEITLYQEYFIEYKKLWITSKTESFSRIEKYQRHDLHLWNRPLSLFYNHSLNTINLANAIGLDPFDLFKFCSQELKHKFTSIREGVKKVNTNFFADEAPYYSFDSLISSERMGFDSVIALLLELYPLDKVQKVLLQHYRYCIRQMLNKQVAIEHKRKFYAEKRNTQNTHRIYSSKEMKATYRAGAKLFHPDKNHNGTELFKKFNKLYTQGDLKSMLNMIKNYENNS